MNLALRSLTAMLLLAPSTAFACPYAAASSGCGACSSLFGYGTSLLLGLGVGLASVALERRRAS